MPYFDARRMEPVWAGASLRGDTGIGELGLTFTPSQTLPLSFDLGVQGYVGKHEGVGGTAMLTYSF